MQTQVYSWDFLVRFVLAALATWRAAHLISREDGPFDMVRRIRAALPGRRVGMMDCFGCMSLWVAVVIAFFVTLRPADFLIVVLALSGLAMLLDSLSAAPLVVEKISEMQGESANGLLQADTTSDTR